MAALFLNDIRHGLLEAIRRELYAFHEDSLRSGPRGREAMAKFLSSLTAGFALAAAALFSAPVAAQTGIALTGTVTSAEEGPMEGVLVSAKKAGSTITVTVVSDKDGRYGFPAARLAPGQYELRIR